MEKEKILKPLAALSEKLYLKSDEMRLQALLFEVKTGKALPGNAEIGGNSCFFAHHEANFFAMFYESDLNYKSNST